MAQVATQVSTNSQLPQRLQPLAYLQQPQALVNAQSIAAAAVRAFSNPLLVSHLFFQAVLTFTMFLFLFFNFTLFIGNEDIKRFSYEPSAAFCGNKFVARALSITSA